jgi:hypothetical protein
MPKKLIAASSDQVGSGRAGYVASVVTYPRRSILGISTRQRQTRIDGGPGIPAFELIECRQRPLTTQSTSVPRNTHLPGTRSLLVQSLMMSQVSSLDTVASAILSS